MPTGKKDISQIIKLNKGGTMFNLEIKVNGLDKIIKHFEKLEKRIRKIDDKYVLIVSDLFPPEFVKKNTKFSSMDEMFEKSGFAVNSQKDFEKIPNDVWDKFISDNSKFGSWQDMLNAAGIEWAQRQLLKKFK